MVADRNTHLVNLLALHAAVQAIATATKLQEVPIYLAKGIRATAVGVSLETGLQHFDGICAAHVQRVMVAFVACVQNIPYARIRCLLAGSIRVKSS